MQNSRTFENSDKSGKDETADASASRPETILLVEDNHDVRSAAGAMLERHGYRVLEAADGIQALELWEQRQERVALLLTDLVMPAGMSGLELSKRLREDNPGLKVIFISGHVSAGRQAAAMVDDNFLQKPFSPDELLQTIRRCLDD